VYLSISSGLHLNVLPHFRHRRRPQRIRSEVWVFIAIVTGWMGKIYSSKNWAICEGRFSLIGMACTDCSSRTDAISQQEVKMNASQAPSKASRKTQKTVRPVPHLLLELTLFGSCVECFVHYSG
jgi:hypothetical protein